MKTNVSLLFYQKKPKSHQGGPVPVYLRITVNGTPAEVSTGRSCLPAQQQFHIIMETLDTEEATYLWHFPKNIDALKRGIAYVDNQLERIRTRGRQSFLESKPEDFSKIIHDYTDDRKGFVLWKDALEERLW